MNKADYIAQLRASDIDSLLKDKIMELVNANEGEELSFDTTEKIKDVLQGGLDAIFAKEGIELDQNDPEVKAATETFEAEMDKVEKDLAEDVELVNDSLNQLEKAAADLDVIAEEVKTDEVRSQLNS